MRRLVCLLLWLAGLAGLGLLGGELAQPWLAKLVPIRSGAPAGSAGAALAVILFIVLLALGALPAVRGSDRKPVRWGVWQAFWLVAGFVLAELAGLLGFLLLINSIRLVGMLVLHRPPLFDAAGPGANILAVLAGILTAGGWSIWYIRRRGMVRLHDGAPSGIAWRGASRGGYGLAILLALLVLLVAMLLVRVFPPDNARLQNMPDAQLYGAAGWPAMVLLLVVIFIAPPLEEFVFRGGVFAALATRYRPFTAGMITTLAFVAVHAPEKIYYPPGFIDVGLMAAAAAWMRVKYRSIRPGMLLHALYNAGLLIAVGFSS